MEEVICRVCIMNNTTRFFKLNKNGVIIARHKKVLKKNFQLVMKLRLQKKYKESKGKKYDCVWV